MVRLGLTFWFTVSALLGPGLCCCTVAGAAPVTATNEKDADPLPCACCECSQEKGETQTPAPKPHRPPCPCQQEYGKARLAAAAPTVVDDYRLGGQVVSPDGDLARSFGAVAELFGQSPDARSNPPRSGRDILRLHHVLRC
jgi:hypothetical protein